MVSRRRTARLSQGGYNLVTLVVLIAVMQIVIAAALPNWTQAMRREKEAELVFRGLQYAEAIRVFQLRHGRYPVRLEELIEVEPRSIRRLWKDPMTDDGEWALLLVAAGTSQGQQGRNVGTSQGGLQAVSSDDLSGGRERREEQDRGRRRRRRPGSRFGEPQQTVGPIIGVHSKSDESGLRTFFGATKYSEWRFTAELLPTSPGPIGDANVPRLHTGWLGRGLPEGIEPQDGGVPGLEDGSAPSVDGARDGRRQPADGQRPRGRRGRRESG